MTQDARIVREEKCPTTSAQTTCDVIEIKDRTNPQALYTFWVDKKRHLVLRRDIAFVWENGSDVTSIIYDVTELNAQLPDDLFVFTPPRSAKQVASFFR